MRLRWNTAPNIQRDFVTDFEALQSWFWVPNCYSLMEQAFKLLWAVRNGAPAAGFKDYLVQSRRPPSLSHDLGFIYSTLDSKDRNEIENAFSAYQRLHDYIPVGSAEELTSRIGGNGYTRWRYFLLQGGDGIPTTEIGAMIEIAFATAGILEREQHGGSRFRTVDRRIAEGIREALFQIVSLQMVKHQSEPDFETARYRSLWDQLWESASNIVNDAPGSIYLALDGSRPDAQDSDELSLIESLCALLPENDSKNFRMHFFKRASTGRPRGTDNDAYFVKLYRDRTLYELRKFTLQAGARDIEVAKRATDYLSSLASDFDLAGIPADIASAMEQVSGNGLPSDLPLSGDAEKAVRTLASFQPIVNQARGAGQSPAASSARA